MTWERISKLNREVKAFLDFLSKCFYDISEFWAIKTESREIRKQNAELSSECRQLRKVVVESQKRIHWSEDVRETKAFKSSRKFSKCPTSSKPTHFRLHDAALERYIYHVYGNKWVPIIPRSLQREVLEVFYDDPTASHQGYHKTYDRI